MRGTVCALLLLLAVVHLYPIVGLFGADALKSYYGVLIQDPNLLILMRHRGILFGIIGTYIAFSAFRPAWQPVAIVAALVSMLSFVVLTLYTEGHNARLHGIAMIDSGMSVLGLLVALLLYAMRPRQSG